MVSKKRPIDDVLSEDEFEERRSRLRVYRKSDRDKTLPPSPEKTIPEPTNGTSNGADNARLEFNMEDLAPNPFSAPKPKSWKVELDIRRSSELSDDDFNACFDLIKTTSRADYVASSWGWDPKGKTVEMKHPDMTFILIREHLPSMTDVNGTNTSATVPHVPLPAAAPDMWTPSTSTVGGGPFQQLAASPSQSSSSRPLGFLSFKLEMDDPPNDDRPVLYIYELHLARELRGAGLGTHLLTIAERICARAGFRKVMLTVFTRNKAASGFYRQLGYFIDEDASPRSREIRGRRIPPDYRIRSKWIGVPEDNPNDMVD